MSHEEKLKSIYALPQAQAHTAIVEALASDKTLGPVVQQIIALIKQGMRSLPAILAALKAAGVALPPWVTLIVTLLLTIIPAEPNPGAPA